MRKNATAGVAPTAGQLVLGEIGINTADGAMYIKKNDNSIVQVGNVASAGTLTGATLASNVLASSLTSVGTLTGLTVNGTLSLGTTALISSPSATALAIQSTIPAGTGVTPTVQIICPSSAYTLTDGTATQPVFDTPQDTITLQASTTYMFDGQYLLTTGGTSHIKSMSFVLTTATMTNCTWSTSVGSPSALNAATSGAFTAIFNSVAGGNVNTSSNAANTMIRFQGIMRVNAGGTLVPNIKFSIAPTGTNSCLVGSYLKFYPIGSNAINFVGTAIG